MPLTLVPYVFLLGLASGIACLAITSYRSISPNWLKWLLIISGCLMMSRYVSMVLFLYPEMPTRFWGLRHFWFGSAIGLTLPSVVAVDQLLRHPAMTPAKLIRWYAPFLAVYLAVMFLGAMSPQLDKMGGWTPRLQTGWLVLLSITQGSFVIMFVYFSITLMRKIPSLPIRRALFWLTMGQVYLGIDGLVLSMGGWYVRPFLYSEVLTLLAIWYAFDTSAALVRTGA